MARAARAAGIPADRLLIEPRSRNTRENARFTVDILKPRLGAGADAPLARIVVVSDAWHLPRAVMLFRRAVGRLEVGVVRVEGRGVGWRPARLCWWMAALREVPAFAADLVRG